MTTIQRPVDIFLSPGKVAAPATTAVIRTIVGSCVAVCLWDPERRIGGMNHFLLARPGTGATPDARFGSVATEKLINDVCRNGAVTQRLRAFVIGGGHPVDAIRATTIGDDNVAVALEVLCDRGVVVVRRQTGGDHGRRLLFSTGSGELIVENVRAWRPPGREERSV